MGRITLHSFVNKKWNEIELKASSDEVLWHGMDMMVGDPSLDLYNKYFPKKTGKIKEMSFGDILFFYRNIFKEDLQWYEKLTLRLSMNYFYLNEESIGISIKALKKMDEIYGADGNYYRYLANVLENIEVKDDMRLALGYSSGGFWGTDIPIFLLAAKGVNPDKLADNYHMPPHVMGYDVAFDIKIPD